MATKSKRNSGGARGRIRDRETISEFASAPDGADLLLGGRMVGASAEERDITVPRVLEATTFAARWKGKKGKDGYKLCRELIEGGGSNPQPNEFLAPMFAARCSVFNLGFRVMMSEAAWEVVKKKAPWFEAEAAKLAMEAWTEFETCNNAAVMWLNGQKRLDGSTMCMVLDTESIKKFSNSGADILTLTTEKRELTDEEREAWGDHMASAIEKGEDVTLEEEEGEYFAVATGAKRGRGLALPLITGSLDALAHLEAIRTGDMNLAYDSRTVIKHWTMGYEIRNGERAGTALRHATPKRTSALKTSLLQKKGFVAEFFSNFDVAMKFVTVPPELFDAKKYDGGLMRLHRWGGALALMAGKDAPEGTLNLVRAEAQWRRAEIKALLEKVFNHKNYGLKLPKDERIRVGWSPVAFIDARTMASTIGQFLGSGVISVRTAREWLDVDNDEEVLRLTEEAGAEGYAPNFQAFQGDQTKAPGARSTPDNGGSQSKGNGRPPGGGKAKA